MSPCHKLSNFCSRIPIIVAILAVIFPGRIALLLLEFFSCGLIACLLVRWSTNALANAIDVDIHGQSFVATDVERSDYVHMLLGALQQ